MLPIVGLARNPRNFLKWNLLADTESYVINGGRRFDNNP
jgi:hypothetical protein